MMQFMINTSKRYKRIQFLGKLFETNGFELRIAGGAVRDIIKGKEPKDIDFATDARPEQSLELLKRHEDIFRIIVTASGQKHGTVAVKFKETEIDFKRIKLTHPVNEQIDNSPPEKKVCDDKPQYDQESPYEITTLRCDRITDGRHAEVVFINDWKLDAERRDLTINAMFLTLDGRLIDFFNGESDLKNGIVKFVGDADSRLKEDYLRILRYFRFWSRYGKDNDPDPATFASLQRNLDGLEMISGERIWQELKKILSHFPCSNVVKLMFKSKLLRAIHVIGDDQVSCDKYYDTLVENLSKAEKNVKYYSDDILKPKLDLEPQSLPLRKDKDLLPVILFASLICDEEQCMTAHKRLKFSNLERDCILYIVKHRSELSPTLADLKFEIAMTNEPDRPHKLNCIRGLLIYSGEFDLMDSIMSWKVPPFPLPGFEVAQEVKKHNLNRSLIKVLLESLKLEWATNNYGLSKEKLIEILNSKLMELKEKKTV